MPESISNIDGLELPLIPLQPQLDFFVREKRQIAVELMAATGDEERKRIMQQIINANLVINSVRRRQEYVDYQMAKRKLDVRTDQQQ